ncbi:MAG: glycosyltransferase family 4 protein [bacterium]
MPSKKIAVIHSGFQNDYLDKLFSLFNDEGYQVDFYTRNKEINEYPNVKNIYHFESKVDEKNPELIEKISKEIELLIKDKNYDYILSDCCPLSFGSNVFHRHSLDYRKSLSPNFIYEFLFAFGHLKELNYFKKWHTQKHQKIFVMSNEMKKDYAKALSIPKEKIVVLTPGFNTNPTTNIESERKNNSTDEFIFGLSAMGFSSKGGYILLDAMRRIKYKNIKCKIIYPKHEKNYYLKFLIQIMGIKDRVEFVGVQKNMTEFYNSIDCLVVSSLSEAFGRVVTEAMINKTPVIIGSNVGACDIINDGQNGFVFEFDKNSGKNLALKMSEVYEKRNNLESLIANAYETALGLSWDNFAQKIFEEIKK